VRTLAEAFAGLAARVLWKLSPGEAEALANVTLSGHIKARPAPACAWGVLRLCVVTGAGVGDAWPAQAIATWSPASCSIAGYFVNFIGCGLAAGVPCVVSHACLHPRQRVCVSGDMGQVQVGAAGRAPL